MEEEPIRKLAVLLHADVVGSTALVQLDETLAHRRLQDTFKRFAECILRRGGVAHEIRGDALVAEFAKASDAVTASLEFQAANTDHNKNLADDILPVVRVGIAMGEVVVADGTITGEGVVLAQRLEQLAEPGGVCIQDAVYQTVPKRLPFEYALLGERSIKGFDEPVRVYAVGARHHASAPQPDTPQRSHAVELTVPDEPSIAVLPFTNMTADPEQEHFSDGITEDIITALSRIPSMLVIARNSTMVYKGKPVNVQLVGRQQGVRYVLEGSVRRAGRRVRVTAQLTDVLKGRHLWADRYDRNVDDVFEVQDDITQNIAVEMRAQIAEGEQIRLWAGGTRSVRAWEYVARGNLIFLSNVREKNIEARQLAEEALRLDPDYINAIVLLGHTHWFDALWHWGESSHESLEESLACGSRALELDKTHPESHELLAACASLQGAHEKAIQLAEEAVALAPSHASNVHWLGWVLRSAGHYTRAVEQLKRAMRLSPVFPPVYLTIIGSSYHLMNENDLAIQNLKEAVKRESGAMSYKVWLTSALIEAGCDEWTKVAEDIVRVAPAFSVTEWAATFEFLRDKRGIARIVDNLLAAGLPR